MRRRQYLSALSGGALAGLAGCSGRFNPFPSSDPPPRLAVDGRWLVDPAGNDVVLRGVNVVDPWWGTTFTDLHGQNYWDTIRLATAESEGWHARVLRVPIEPRSIEEVGLDAVVKNYIDRVVQLAARRGFYVIIDYHAVERYDTEDIDERVRSFWGTVAPRYADQPHVLYELFNEPTKPSGNGIDSWTRWRSTAQPWVDLVRGKAPSTPLIVGSPRWSSMAKYAPDAPFDGDHLLYSSHVFPSWDEQAWESTFGEPAMHVPMIVTEWGYVNVTNDDRGPHMIASTSGWGEPFREWLDAHENVSWTAWCFSSEWNPPMFDDDWNLLGGDDYMGEFTRGWLADLKDAHQPGTEGPGDGSPTQTVDLGTPPTPPENFTVEDTGPTAMWFSWDPSDDPDGDSIAEYRVHVTDVIVRTISGEETSAVVRSVDPATTYDVTVTAVDDRGLESEPSESVTVTTTDPAAVTATVSRTDSPPSIDGAIDDGWDDRTAHSLDRVLVEASDSATAPTASWRAQWDDEALYCLISITDATAIADSGQVWHDDTVELYLDPDNSSERSYDDVNDAQFMIRRGGDRVFAGGNSISAPDGLDVAQAETDDGWTVELSIPWADFEITPSAGHQIGLDVHVNDDDDGSSRDAKVAWFATTDESWEDPRLFPTVELVE